MEEMSQLMDEAGMHRTLARIAHEIIERNNGCSDVVLAGVRRRGVTLAGILASNIEKFEGYRVPVGTVDITLYRDDLSEWTGKAETRGCDFPVSITGKTVILVDDVIYTGRTARAAMEAVFKSGRPKRLQLAELVDRGHRELPIKPDYVGKNIPTSHTEIVKVMVDEFDGINQVCLVRENRSK